MTEKKEMYEPFFMLDDKRLELKRINPNKLKKHIESLYDINIRIEYKPSIPNDSYNSLILIPASIGDKFIIWINPNLNPCWKRYSLCKELLQIYYYFYLKRKNRYNEYPKDKICEQIGDLHKYHEILDDSSGEVPDKYVPELITFCATIDMFFYLDQKEFIRDLGTKLIDKGDIPFTHYDLSEMYKCPQDMTIRYRKSIEKMSLQYSRDKI
jgi:hypothetical protein